MNRMLVVESEGSRLRASSADVYNELDSIRQHLAGQPFEIIANPRKPPKEEAWPHAVEISWNQASRNILKDKFHQLVPHRGKFHRLRAVESPDTRLLHQKPGSVVGTADLTGPLIATSILPRLALEAAPQPREEKCAKPSGKSRYKGLRRRKPRRSDQQETKRILERFSKTRQGTRRDWINQKLVFQVLPHVVYLTIILALILQPGVLSTQNSSIDRTQCRIEEESG